MRRAVLLFPSGLTLLNLFFGVFAIITASRGDFRMAGILVLAGGICDALDGRVARATNAGSQFGEELDSLVDAISFGFAPAMIMYFAVLNHDGWDWIFVFLFAACAVMRLARFNIEQAGTAKTYFSGLPSPAAGCTLASYYWFSQSWLYDYGAIGNLPWQEMLRFLMAALAGLMISQIPYPVFPRTGWRSKRAIAGTLLLIGSVTLLATKRLEYFFPLCLLYVAWGPIRFFLGLFDRRQPTIPYDLSEGEDEEDDEFEVEAARSAVPRPSARDTRPAREDRPRKPRDREETVARAPRTEEAPARAERPERPARPDRPERTEAERAARREKRDKREGRPERTPRPPRGDVVLVESDLAPAPVSEQLLEMPASDDVVGSITGAEEASATAPGVDGAPPRKRKRRRRRGERKERGPSDGTAALPGERDDDGASGDDGPDADEARSPYSQPSASSAVHVDAPAPIDSPTAPPPVPPAPAHVTSPSPEPHE